MQVKDIVKSGSKDDNLKILKQFEESLMKLASDIRQSKPRDEKNLLLHNLTVCSANQIKGLQLIYAWIARNLFELNLIVKYILLSPDNVAKFGNERVQDELEMLERILEIKEIDEDEALTFKNRIKRLKQTADKHHRTLSKPLPIWKLADATDMGDEHKSYYKLYSKYVHPSSWLINGPQDVIYSSEIRNTCLVNAQIYAGNIARMISDETGINV